MNNLILTQPLFEPLTLAEVWDHLRITPMGSPLASDQDSMLTRNIKSARVTVEELTRRSLIQRTVRQTQGSFPETLSDGIPLNYPPVQSIVSVWYRDLDNVLRSLPSSDWFLAEDVKPVLCFTQSFSIPQVYSRPDAVMVDYIAGYMPQGSPATTQEEYAANVPSDLKEAVLITVELLQGNTSPADRQALVDAREAICSYNRVQLTL